METAFVRDTFHPDGIYTTNSEKPLTGITNWSTSLSLVIVRTCGKNNSRLAETLQRISVHRSIECPPRVGDAVRERLPVVGGSDRGAEKGDDGSLELQVVDLEAERVEASRDEDRRSAASHPVGGLARCRSTADRFLSFA